MMDEQTALVLALQLVALFSIAGALLLYLLCKIQTNPEPEVGITTIGGGKSVVITSCDTAIGLQLALHLSGRGFRVFAGLKDGAASGDVMDSVAARVLSVWQKERESGGHAGPHGTIVVLPLDVTREDLMHEAVDIIRAHLPAGEDGVWAVMNTSGLSYRGRLEQQDVAHWDVMLKTNVVGLLRTARTFQGLLRNTHGRLVTLGEADCVGAPSVVCAAARHAVRGASDALRRELAPLSIHVVTFNTATVSADLLFASPKLDKIKNEEVSVDMSGCLEYHPKPLPLSALQDIEGALTCSEPKQNYTLMQKSFWSNHFCVVKAI